MSQVFQAPISDRAYELRRLLRSAACDIDGVDRCLSADQVSSEALLSGVNDAISRLFTLRSILMEDIDVSSNAKNKD